MTPRPPHPKVLKTAMGAAEFVQLNDPCTTIEAVRGLRSKGCRVYALETTEKSQSLFEASFFVDNAELSVAFVLGNELIGEQNHFLAAHFFGRLTLLQNMEAWTRRLCASAMASSSYRPSVLRIL